MKHFLSTLSIALLLALSSSGVSYAEPLASPPDGAVPRAVTKDNLLITPSLTRVTRRQITLPLEPEHSFESGMAHNGWDTTQDSNRFFKNFRAIVASQEVLSISDEINAKYFEALRQKRLVEASA